MATRSRKGCIDCKQAKIKCDEQHPFCGTCTRRRRQCRGYATPKTRSSSHHHPHGVSAGAYSPSSVSSESLLPNGYPDGGSEVLRAAGYVWVASKSPSSSGTQNAPFMTGTIASSTLNGGSVDDSSNSPLLGISHPSLAPPRSPSFIPLNEIQPADKPLIEIYFLRHPSDMVMRNDSFIDEMNCAVISLLQKCPVVVSDSLCAIGENYIKETADASLVSSRKLRLLNRLRLVNEDGRNPELVLLLLLALCGAELTSPHSDGKGEKLIALIENVALVLEFHSQPGRELNSAAKYFTRGLARQDLLLSLSRMQRTRINTSIWLDDYSRSHVDRLLGLTATLVPILTQLAALAEDVQYAITDHSGGDMHCLLNFDQIPMKRSDLEERAASIRAQLLTWRPIQDSSLTMRTSRTLLLHAAAWRAAALLYLFRLFNRPGSSVSADGIALSMAYEIMTNISGPPDDIKLSLWPLFLAACEVEHPDDRDLASQMFNDICSSRPILTVKRTKSFCVDQIWPARDRGENWDWMQLVRFEDNVFTPL
ncbi:unnamed protein product [Clonostachys rhizophaga]|uniref:Zn(2)-C6 fungal-type domain-containing protein n=1 Tax=Clonostachys rhizophaga TaxID=160324 RepID=A0A9N9V5P4_9HYPO|nr:unnamed protein product [Clonostachys rhizophaga]